jgi:hypothetical protein
MLRIVIVTAVVVWGTVNGRVMFNRAFEVTYAYIGDVTPGEVLLKLCRGCKLVHLESTRTAYIVARTLLSTPFVTTCHQLHVIHHPAIA